nr:MAG: hypothetical protein [Bacteriophage sp.]
MTEVACGRDEKHAAVDGSTFTRDEKSGYFADVSARTLAKAHGAEKRGR